MKRKRIIIITVALIAVAALAAVLAVCGGKSAKRAHQYGVLQGKKFDAVYLNVSIEDFMADGFRFGDSCDVSFSNGLSFEDLPFYSGYYTRSGMPVVVGYPGNDHITVTRTNGGLWEESGLTENDTATVTLRQAGKYLTMQETLSQAYSNDKADYRDDVQFANFRAMSGGALKENFLYRGASPVDDRYNRAASADALLQETGIRFILDLADSEEDLLGYRGENGFSSFYAAGLYDAGCTALLDMTAAFDSADYKQKLAQGLRAMLSAEGPVYIHCTEGKDRTGFVCFLLEALAGASYDEMQRDYMKTYENYYGISKTETPDKYEAVVNVYFDSFAAYLHGTDDAMVLASAAYDRDAAGYLLSAGMTEEEIAALRRMITKDPN